MAKGQNDDKARVQSIEQIYGKIMADRRRFAGREHVTLP